MKVNKFIANAQARDGSPFPTRIDKGPQQLYKIHTGTRRAIYVSMLKAVDKISGFYEMDGNKKLKGVSFEYALQFV